MTHGLCEILKSYLNSVPFADLVAGLAMPMKIKSGTVDKTIPAYFRETKTSCLTDDYVNLMPDSKLMSIMFWEEVGMRQTADMPKYYEFEADLRLIVWWNYEKVNVDLFSPTSLITSIIKTIPAKIPNTNNYSAILVEYLGQEPEGSSYNRYTIDEAESQFMTYPYDSVALNFRVYFRMAVDCIDMITIKPKICGDYLSFLIHEPTAEVSLRIAPNSNITINWGDGTTTTAVAGIDVGYPHTYAESDRDYFCYLTGILSDIVTCEFIDGFVSEIDGCELFTGAHNLSFANNEITDITTILGDIVSIATAGAFNLDLSGGTNADVTPADCIYITTLTVLGWTVTYNGVCPP